MLGMISANKELICLSAGNLCSTRAETTEPIGTGRHSSTSTKFESTPTVVLLRNTETLTMRCPSLWLSPKRSERYLTKTRNRSWVQVISERRTHHFGCTRKDEVKAARALEDIRRRLKGGRATARNRETRPNRFDHFVLDQN